MERMQIELEAFIDDGVRQFILNAIDYHGIGATGLPDYFPVNFVLRGKRRDALGGVLGQVWGCWLHITHLWISEGIRGARYGAELMEGAETCARARCVIGAMLEIHSFQARPFSERLVYEVFASLEGYPPGDVKFFLKKAFALIASHSIFGEDRNGAKAGLAT